MIGQSQVDSRESALSDPRIVAELKHKDGPKTYYRIQLQIKNWRTTGGIPSYNLISLHFDSYEISQTEILKSTGGSDLLGKWIGLDPGLSSDETRISLIDVLCDRYYTEYANLVLWPSNKVMA